jgi:maltose-binding protein MalE
MKNLNTLGILSLSILILSSCSSKTTTAPSQNKALNSITISNAEKKNDGTMQKSLDRWLKDDWTPTISKDNDIKVKEKDKSRDFTLQEYIDKSEVYIENSDSSHEESHSQKIKSLPVIGN